MPRKTGKRGWEGLTGPNGHVQRPDRQPRTEARTLSNNDSKLIGLRPEIGPPATVTGPQLSATVLEDEFGNEEEEWDFGAIDRSVAMALNNDASSWLLS